MDVYGQIKRSIRRIAGTESSGVAGAGVAGRFFVAEVKSRNDVDAVVSVEIDGTVFTGARLRAVIDGATDRVVAFPKVGSYVLCADLSGDLSRIAVVGATEVDCVDVTVNGENLYKCLSDFIDEVAKIIVVQGTSPNVPALQDIKIKIGKILK